MFFPRTPNPVRFPMIARPPSLEKLLEILRTLPSVGPKMSERIAFHILRMSEEDIHRFMETLERAYEEVRPCPACGHWDDRSPCRICRDSTRDRTILCVVENSQDVQAVSRIKNFNGIYHVLGGTLSPLEGIGPQDLQIQSLLQRLQDEPIQEVILSLNSDMEGETTAQYLAKQIHDLGRPHGIRITRPAQGLPSGGELEYMDEMTLTHAFEGRREFDRY